MTNSLNENLEKGDLKRLVHPELHIDEYVSKMGSDADVCVVSFKVSGKEPSSDLVSFIEKGYDWVLDADVSSGEKEGGDYLVFVELQRNKDLPANVIRMMDEVMSLTEQDLEDWRVRYKTDSTDHNLTEEDLAKLIPLTPEDYDRKFPPKEEEEEDEVEDDDAEHQRKLDHMKATAGVKVNTKAPKNEYTESLRIAAGLK